MKYAINAIYKGTEGEGVRIGIPQVFVRFQGCAVGCVNCDSKETWDFNTGLNLNLDQISERIRHHKLSRVSITGGDPLHPKLRGQALTLVQELKSKNYFVNIEASGTCVVQDIFDLVDFISFDIKTPSTGVKTSLNLLKRMVEEYPRKTQFKAVIENREDFDFVYSRYMEILDSSFVPWCLTPVYTPGKIFDKSFIHQIMEWNDSVGGIFRVIGQQHKWFYGPYARQV